MSNRPGYNSVVLLATLAAVNLLAWSAAWLVFAYRPVLLGVAMLAWVFGLRHAVDADHITAIDNVVRKLMTQGDRPLAAGLYFSLGHSTVVVAACAAIASGMLAMRGPPSAATSLSGVVGTALSAAFLLAIAVANVLILRGVWREFVLVRSGSSSVVAVGEGGLLVRILRPVLRAVTHVWHMYPVGFLFAIGFDTATEVGLLGVSATQAAQGLTFWQIMLFPALFTAGMALVDTADSVLMVGVYGWTYVRPLRKLWYNLTITAAAVLMAVLVGGIELLGLLVDQFALDGRGWRTIAELNDNMAELGFVLIAIFVLCWTVSALVYRWKGYHRLAASDS